MIIKELLNKKENGINIGNSIKYCSNNIFDLVQLYSDGSTINELAIKCIEYSKLHMNV